MKLYDLRPGDLFRITGDLTVPPAHITIPENAILQFSHIDGMYSLCYLCNGETKRPIVHPVAWTEVEKINLDKTEVKS